MAVIPAVLNLVGSCCFFFFCCCCCCCCTSSIPTTTSIVCSVDGRRWSRGKYQRRNRSQLLAIKTVIKTVIVVVVALVGVRIRDRRRLVRRPSRGANSVPTTSLTATASSSPSFVGLVTSVGGRRRRMMLNACPNATANRTAAICPAGRRQGGRPLHHSLARSSNSLRSVSRPSSATANNTTCCCSHGPVGVLSMVSLLRHLILHHFFAPQLPFQAGDLRAQVFNQAHVLRHVVAHGHHVAHRVGFNVLRAVRVLERV
mmetsp:Transcript_40160/g.79075  ORF Transcript_40160/g.79075 Transcript_40160/m.79075 type:complete len:258 (-) Transcript_40160:233-1006(-)